MPRGSATKNKATQVSKATEPKQIEGFKKQVVPIFPLVVQSFKGKVPGQDGYDPEKDRMRIGFVFGDTTVPTWLEKGTLRADVTAYDFLTFPGTGMRMGQTREPSSCGFNDLTNGISEWVNLPPVAIWSEGKWLSELVWELNFDIGELPIWMEKRVQELIQKWPQDGVPEAIYNFWVTSGEGTPGNHLYRMFEVPNEVCKKQEGPHHPLMWKEELRKRSYNYGHGYSIHTPAKPATGTVTKAKPIPAGVRFRCTDCGHWFGQSDLIGHKEVCDTDSDWAMMCHSDCGCENLDQASKPKPGFPRKKPEAVEAVTSHGEVSEGKEVKSTEMVTT